MTWRATSSRLRDWIWLHGGGGKMWLAEALKSFSMTSLTYGRDKRPLKWILLPLVYTVSKNVPPLTCYNFEIHNPITISFGTCVTEKVKNQTVLCFPTSPIYCLQHQLAKKETQSNFSTFFLLNYAPNSPELSALITRRRESYNDTTAWIWVVSQKIEEIKQRLVEFWQCRVKNAIFVFPYFVR